MEKIVKLKDKIEESSDPSIYFQSYPTEENFVIDGRCNYVYLRGRLEGTRCQGETHDVYCNRHFEDKQKIKNLFKTPSAKRIVFNMHCLNDRGDWVTNFTIEWSSPCDKMYYKILCKSKDTFLSIIGVPTPDGKHRPLNDHERKLAASCGIFDHHKYLNIYLNKPPYY